MCPHPTPRFLTSPCHRFSVLPQNTIDGSQASLEITEFLCLFGFVNLLRRYILNKELISNQGVVEDNKLLPETNTLNLILVEIFYNKVHYVLFSQIRNTIIYSYILKFSFHNWYHKVTVKTFFTQKVFWSLRWNVDSYTNTQYFPSDRIDPTHNTYRCRSVHNDDKI